MSQQNQDQSPTGNEAPRGVVPAGWKVVPEEPTAEMRDAANEAWMAILGCSEVNLYCAMLAAAPPPPVSTEPDNPAGAERDALVDMPAGHKLCFVYCGDGICTCQNRALLPAEIEALGRNAALHPSPPTASGAAAPVGEGLPNLPDGYAYVRNEQGELRVQAPAGMVAEPHATPTPAPHPVPAGQTKEGAR